VKTSMNVIGGTGGTYRFDVAVPANVSESITGPRLTAPRVTGDVERFRSRPDFAVASVRITRNSRRAFHGDLFLAPQSSPVQDGPQIRDRSGRLVWYQRLPNNQYVSDFRTQTLDGEPVLTWWQGYVRQGLGNGVDVILSDRYEPIALLPGDNGIHPDLHEFRISPQNTAMVTAYNPIWWSERSVGGPARALVRDAVIQEIDIPTGLVLYQWDALDHIPLSNSYKKPWKNIHKPWDFFHVNSVQELDDGNLLISSRNTWAAYKVDHHTGSLIWTLGGKSSSFKMGSGAQFAFQHDVELHPGNIVSAFDDGAGPPIIHNQARVLGLQLNFGSMTATRAFSFNHAPSILSYFEGNAQRLPNGDYFAGYGSDPHFSEFSPSGALVFDGRFVSQSFHDRAYSFAWSATPAAPPAIAVRRRGGSATVYASWNGATDLRGWRVLAGPNPSALRVLRRVGASGFETAIRVGKANYLAVVALGSGGRPISGRSAIVKG